MEGGTDRRIAAEGGIRVPDRPARLGVITHVIITLKLRDLGELGQAIACAILDVANPENRKARNHFAFPGSHLRVFNVAKNARPRDQFFRPEVGEVVTSDGEKAAMVRPEIISVGLKFSIFQITPRNAVQKYSKIAVQGLGRVFHQFRRFR